MEPRSSEPSKIKTARILLLIYGWLEVAAALLLVVSRHELGSLIVGIVIIFFGAVQIVTAYAVLDRKKWGKILGIILGILMLPSIPVGLLFGIFILIGLLGSQANTWFQGGLDGSK